MLSRVLRTLILLAFVIPAIPASAQQTGAITGKVVDTGGGVLPGVTVEARANVLPAPRVTTTGANGEYRLPALPPGAYTLTFVLSGMQNVTRQAEVQLSQDTVVEATLGVQGVTESIEVTATASLVERDSATIKSGLSNAQIMALPVGQEYRDLLKMIPGVQFSAGHRARTERRRQRTGQRLQLRRRERHAPAVRHAVGRPLVARHRSGDDGQGRRPGSRLRSFRRVLYRFGEQVRGKSLRRRGQLSGADRRDVRRAHERIAIQISGRPELADREYRRAGDSQPRALLRVVLSPREPA